MPVSRRKRLERIRKLAFPPAWTDVWICLTPNGHIQARGRDARGRKQYRYHARWLEVRSTTKFHRMLCFAEALPRIRQACERDMRRRRLSREKVVATLVRLLEVTCIRIGHEEYTRKNGSYGLTTLRDRHVQVHECTELPGHELFRYLAEDGTLHRVDSSDVNGYIRDQAGQEFSAKDFRTWAGTVLTARLLRALPPFSSPTHTERNVVQCVKAVAARLGNTPPVCRRSYVHPGVVDSYLQRRFGSVRARDDEAFVKAVLTAAMPNRRRERRGRAS